MNGIGIDAGTFHTVATYAAGSSIRIPRRSIPSIALDAGKKTYVGVDATDQIGLAATTLIRNAKLSMGQKGVRDQKLELILRQLIEQAVQDLGAAELNNIVLTVPPAWKSEHCQILQAAINPIVATKVRFIHEPIALLISAMYLAPKHTDFSIVTKLDNADLILVCDWGAGTVDVALVQIKKDGLRHEFSCIGELTELGQGGTAIAEDVIREREKSKNIVVENSTEKMAFRLQEHWQGNSYPGLDFSDCDSITRNRRHEAAKVICGEIDKLFSKLGIEDRSGVLCLLHGGPLESSELRSFLENNLKETLNFLPSQFLHIGNNFSELLHSNQIPWRRDVMVAAGAALFAARGEALPEFEYEIALRDSFGKISSPVRLVRAHNLAGRLPITPPFCGVDYYVDVQQLRRGSLLKTAIKAELRLHVREGAVVMYEIAEAGVGYARLKATEYRDLPCPMPFADARLDSKELTEHSTRFSINLE